MANEEKTERQKLKEALDKVHERSGRHDEELVKKHREAGVSMFGGHPSYPGEVIEITPDGRWFIIDIQNQQEIRLREVEPQPLGE
jgi:hypothetical protein